MNTTTSSPDACALHYLTLTQVADLIRGREVSPVAVTEAMLERIGRLDARLNSYATVTEERALNAAQAAEQEIAAGRYRGPLHGVPVAVKDLCSTKGTRTMAGLAVRRDHVPDFDATVVSRLEDAGAVLLGKLNMTEGAMAGYNRAFDIPVNPWGAEYWAGASSSGSGVATAAGLCFASLGSDTGGSIRFPSMANGTVGLKPTYGLVSRYGVLPLAESLDHVGPMTRSTTDAAIMLRAIAGHDPTDPTSLDEPPPPLLDALDDGIEGLRIGYDRELCRDGTDPGLVRSIERALVVLADLGAKVVDVAMPEDTRAVGEIWFAICAAEAYAAHRDTFPSRAEEYGPYFRDLLEAGEGVTKDQYADASRWRQDFTGRLNALLESLDALVCPAGGITFPIENEMQYRGSEDLLPLFEGVQMHFTIPADFAGTPALAMPCGFSGTGIPHALQFMGRRLSEGMLCRIGHAYEKATDWHDRHPPV